MITLMLVIQTLTMGFLIYPQNIPYVPRPLERFAPLPITTTGKARTLLVHPR
jgi:hypothetical protein